MITSLFPYYIILTSSLRYEYNDSFEKNIFEPTKDEINKISLYKLFKWVKTNLPSDDSNILLNGKLQLVCTNDFSK